MAFSFLKIIIKKTVIVQLNQALIFESKDKIVLVLLTLILSHLSGSGNNFVALLLMSFKYL